MPRRRTPDRGDPLAEPVWDAQVTIVRGDRDRRLRQRVADLRAAVSLRAAKIVAVAVALATLSAIAEVAFVRPRGAVTAGVVAGDHLPLRCRGATITAADPAYARVKFDPANPCWQYGAEVTAIFHFNGEWGLVVGTTPRPSVFWPGCTTPSAIPSWFWRDFESRCVIRN